MDGLNKYLFVCYANKNRSIVGESVFREMLLGRGFRVGNFKESGEFDFYVDFAGINPEDESRRFDNVMNEGVRTIFVADERIRRLLKSDFNFDDEPRTVNLEIPDIYDIANERKKRVLEEYMWLRLVYYLPRRG